MKTPNISPIFIGLLAFSVLTAIFLNTSNGAVAVRIVTSILILSIWVIGLCLHEFAHAFTSHIFGDTSIENKGYLSLNPLLYADIRTSIILPIIILAIGGLPLPGGAVYLRHDLIKTKWKISLTYLAGPMASFGFAILIAVLLNNSGGLIARESPLFGALSAAAFLQVYAAIFNLLPIPGFDGFGTIAAFLPPPLKASLQKIGALAFVFILLAIFAFPDLFSPLVFTAFEVAQSFGIELIGIVNGLENFMVGF